MPELNRECNTPTLGAQVRRLIACSVFIGVVGTFVAWLTWSIDFRYRSAANMHVMEVWQRLRIGSDRATVHTLCNERTSVGIMYAEEGKDTGMVFTVPSLGAQNWVIWVAYSDDKVASFAMRTYDDRRVHPIEAPDDVRPVQKPDSPEFP